jgi:hypothetical protein
MAGSGRGAGSGLGSGFGAGGGGGAIAGFVSGAGAGSGGGNCRRFRPDHRRHLPDGFFGARLHGRQVGFSHPQGGGGRWSDPGPLAFLPAGHDGRAAFQGAHHVILDARTGPNLNAAGQDAVAFDEILVQPQVNAVGRRDGGPVALGLRYKQHFAAGGLADRRGGRGRLAVDGVEAAETCMRDSAEAAAAAAKNAAATAVPEIHFMCGSLAAGGGGFNPNSNQGRAGFAIAFEGGLGNMRTP